MINLDVYLDRKYNSTNNNCGHFVNEVWQDLTGEVLDTYDITPDLPRRFKKLRKPEEPCFCLMQAHLLPPHIGIYINKKILHFSETGVKHDSIANIIPYYRLSYYR